jgi:GNAT superfamily N-acetyltransferase
MIEGSKMAIPPNVLIRPAGLPDLQALGELGISLMRLHYAFDDRRFMEPNREDANGYAQFLRAQIQDDRSIVLVAEQQGRIVGYAYAAIEPLSWKDLRDEAGYLHDLLVTDEGRRQGVGEGLLDAAIAWLREQGMPRVLLGTAAQNDTARRLFERRGFRATMIEMTLEL